MHHRYAPHRLLTVLVVGAASAMAQDQGSTLAIPGVKLPEPALPADVDIPMPPRALLLETPHTMPPIPIGTGTLPQPQSPQTVLSAPGVVTAPCDLRFFENTAVKPTGTSTSLVGEPSIAQVRDTCLQTGNWYAARSINGGVTWTYINPYTKFAASDGGFCCDQRAVYVPSADITVWTLQYSYSATTQKAGQRIAIANGRTDLQSGTSGSFHSYYFEPADFGLALGLWCDFPDIAYSNGFLYAATNVYTAGGSYSDSVVWRMSLSELAAGGLLNYSYARSVGNLGGASYRLTQGANATMYFGDTRTTTVVRAYRWPDASGTISWNDITVPSFTSSGYSALAPNGINWAGRADSRITGAWATAGEYGFMWHSAPQAGRAQCFVRTIRIATATNTLSATQDTWSATLAFMYPAASVNSRDEIGCAVAVGDDTSVHPTTAYFMVDPCLTSFAGQSVSWFSGNASPTSSSRWGDYFSVQQHPINTTTFVATGMTCRDGGTNGDSEPHYVWFGREADTPTYVTLSVQSTPVTAIAIDVNVADRSGLSAGSTNFVRTYNPQQGYILTAPATHVVGATTYLFDHWSLETTPGAGFTEQPVDQLVLDVSNIGALNDTAIARYLVRRTLTVQSTNPASGIAITVSPVDFNGAGNGSTTFTRQYKDAEVVTLTAPASSTSGPFKQWRVGGVSQGLGVDPINVTMSANRTCIADFYIHTAGSFTAYGTGCAGANGVDVHTAGGTPETGQVALYRVSGARALSSTILVIGFSNTSWLGIPLPLPLAPNAPGCSIYTELVTTLSAATSAAGVATINVPFPNDVNLIGGHLFTQYWTVDLFANALNLTFSNGIDTAVGGNR